MADTELEEKSGGGGEERVPLGPFPRSATAGAVTPIHGILVNDQQV